METKEMKQKLDCLMQATSSIKNAIYWMEKADKKLETAVLYEMMSELSKEISVISDDIKNEMFK